MWSCLIHIFPSFETCSCVIPYCAAFVCRHFPHDAVQILASSESMAAGAPNCKTGELNHNNSTQNSYLPAGLVSLKSHQPKAKVTLLSVKLILIGPNLCENCSYFTLKGFVFNSFGGNVLLAGELQIGAKNSNVYISRASSLWNLGVCL